MQPWRSIVCAQPGSEVSAHYLVLEDGRVIQMVPESRRAWHAGVSFWAGETDINSCSIGIEIANPGHDFGYPDFPKRQIAAVTALCRGIQTRNTIRPERVLAHSDVAPSRKQDPGEKFPWRTLWDSGVGHWVSAAPIAEGGKMLTRGDRGDAVASIQNLLSQYGYGITISGNYNFVTHDVVKAFQRHFRPQRVDGMVDEFDARHAAGPACASRPGAHDGGPRARLRAACLLTGRPRLPIPLSVSRSDGRSGKTERLPGRKVRAPWTSGAG